MDDRIALLDQAQAELASYAPLVAGYFRALLAEDEFTRDEAFELARDFQADWLERVSRPADKGDGEDEPEAPFD